MNFNNYEYLRPNYEEYRTEFSKALQQLSEATSIESATAAVSHLNKLRAQVETAYNLATIRYSIDTNDTFYEEEDQFWNDYQPHFQGLDFEFYQTLLASPLLAALKEHFPATLFLYAQSRIKTFHPDLIPLFQAENQLGSDYSKLVASAQIDFDGNIYTLSQITPLTQSVDEKTRRRATEKVVEFYATHADEFETIYDSMIKTRTQIATSLGFDNYVAFADVLMNRWDYDRPMIETYRSEVLQKIVPVTQKLYQRQAQRNGLEQLNFHDLSLVFPTGNATPLGTPEELVEKARIMYHELAPETGEFFDFMVERNLLDLLSKTGKQAGGYCTYIQDYQSPFIFANFNGTSHDVDVLTHEAGHAFQTYESRWINEPEIVFPNYESCEIHSMSMEFIAWPWMESFFEDQTNKYKFNHLASALQFLPYGVLVDHFQQKVYENPTWTAEERNACWRELEKQYCPERNYDLFPEMEKGIYWFRQGHIFTSPFYYIDYTLAQVCAFQFWKRFNVEQDPTAWQDYLAICQVGGTKTFLEILDIAHLRSPFEAGALDETITMVDEYLTHVSEEEIQ